MESKRTFTDPEGGVWTIVLDADGNVSEMEAPNGTFRNLGSPFGPDLLAEWARDLGMTELMEGR